MRSRINVPQTVRKLGRVLKKAGFSCYLVGGAVRSILMGAKPADYDVATDALPRQVKRLFRRVIPTGIKHGTVTVLLDGTQIEVTTFRVERGYSDGRRPDDVRYVSDVVEDLSRRDFTVNAIAADAVTGEIVDPTGGRRDLQAKVIRAIGDPDLRFEEDGLRLLRACRFRCTLEFEIDEDTLAAIRRARDRIRSVSAERIRDELLKILGAARPSRGLRTLDDTGLLGIVLPELAACKGVEQKGMHRFDVFTHSLLACDAAPSDQPEVRLAALFHDIGKPQAKRETADGEVVFHRHEHISAELAGGILERLRFPNVVRNRVLLLIRNHMFAYSPEWSDAAVRRFLRRVTPEMVSPLVTLRAADAYATAGIAGSHTGLVELQSRIQELLKEDHALSVRDLAVNGHDLAEAGIPKGPEMGAVFNYLLEAVLDDPSQNTPETLLRIARTFYTDYVKRK